MGSPSAGTIVRWWNKTEAGFVIVHGDGGFYRHLTMSDFLQEDVLFAFL
jgi:hypothetical protein